MSQHSQVAIIGGGTGGLCLAQALRRAGVSVAVYERSRTRSERLQGYRVHINPQGSQALHECLPAERWQAFVDTCGTSGGAFGFVTEQLDELMLIEDELTSGVERDPTRAHHSVSRITLHQVLSAGLDGVLHHDKEFRHYSRGPDGTVTCQFADGTTATADVLVGADGAASRVRAQYLPHAERVDTGIKTIAGKFPLTERTRKLLPARIVDGPNTVLPPRGCGMFIAPHDLGDGIAVTADGIGGNDATLTHDTVLFDNTTSYVMWVYAAADHHYPADVALSDLDGRQLRDLVGRMIADWHPALRRLVADSPAQSVSLLPIRTSVPVARWESTNITLLGDAIHSMTPFRGIGANTALRDATLLARNLIAAFRGERGLLDAISDYEIQMTGYGFAAVRDSLRTAKQFISDNRTGRRMFRIVLRFFSAVPPLKRRAFSDQGNK
ncbi:MAG TPA: NAD(P)/FAD-dependent oxidoreductase [Actinophytocola sp.]|uniref:FAD-dependent oxidoreductase n=1 Tax=Actinophytocola sp. TaxID=1872138 RepID=UPI002DBB3F37|nr:NAD(P)/FAD-dependent oxidoreductase [Actinophytocola sp.]HEU5474473.1 NAD(P)/FAD-dependent oxidoreductase [Actinophytocola sp.]